MGFDPTPEQADAVALSLGEGNLAIEALAGAGKTSTLGLIGDAKPVERGVYVAFNRAIVDDVKAKQARGQFASTVRASTAHALGMQAVGVNYRHRLQSQRIYGREIASRLGIEFIDVPLDSGGRKRLMTGRLGGLVKKAVNAYCMTADEEPGGRHVPYIDGIDKTVAGKRTWANNKLVQDHLDPFIKAYWRDIQNVDGSLQFEHGHYLKMWQLTSPWIEADYILYDEAQDANPVMLSIVEQQRDHAQLIFVGDRYQQIYGWNGAVNAMSEVPVAGRTYLTQSFRFGDAVAQVANRALRALDAEILVRGFDKVPSEVRRLEMHEANAILHRTNAAAVSTVLGLLYDGRKVAIVGGAAQIIDFAEAALSLQQGKGTGHPELWPFTSWREVLDFVEGDDEGDELKSMVKVVEQFGAANLVAKMDLLSDERQADIVVSTAHKAKGREWDHVRIGEDFPVPGGDRPVGPEEMRLMYVAATRAKLVLDVEDCPFLRAGGGHTPIYDAADASWPATDASKAAVFPPPGAVLIANEYGQFWWERASDKKLSSQTFYSEEAAWEGYGDCTWVTVRP